MPSLVRLAAACLALAAGACGKLDTFACAQDSECVHDGLLGTCEPDKVCSFPDTDCPSGKKYGEFAGDLSGMCVDGGATTVPTTVPTTGDSSAMTTTTPGTTNPDTTNDPSLASTTTTGPTSDPSSDPTTFPTTDATTDPSTTTGPVCSALGGSCADLPCCDPCTVCDGSMTCTAAPPEMGPTLCQNPCNVCDAGGLCAPAPTSTACTSDCNQLVWQPKVEGATTSCLGYADMPIMAMCDESGQCPPPTPAMCPNPSLMPDTAKLLALCDTVCLGPDAAALCMPGQPSAAVTMASFCALGETPMCADACVLVNNVPTSADDAACDAMGKCVHNVAVCPENLKCDDATDMCLTKCNSDDDCVSNMCMGSNCK